LSRQAVAPQTGNVFAHEHRTEGGPGRWGRASIGAAAGVSVLATVAALRWLRR
jgi:hypothetical protein